MAKKSKQANSSCLQENLKALAKKNARLAEIVANATITDRYKVVPTPAKDGLPTLIDMKLGANFYNNIDPLAFAKHEIEKRKLNLPDLAVILGFGLSYDVLAYLQAAPHAKVLIFEQDAELLKVAFTHINCLAIINAENTFFVGCEDPRISYPLVFNFFNYSTNLYYLRSVNFIENPASFAGAKEYYLASVKIVKDAISQVLNLYGNDPYDSLIGIKYILRNIPIIINNPGVEDLKDAFKGKPGIVVASGPSLDKNIELLKGLHNKAVICAADGSVKILKHRKLPPAHLVTSLERVIETSYLFEGLTPKDVEGSYLAACPVVVPETYAAFPGEKIIVYRSFATFRWLNIPKGIMDTGPSAGNMAFKVLEYLGCSPIILIGQDLALKDDLTSHAEGFHYDNKFDNKYNEPLIEVEGNYSPKVLTRQVYKQFLLHYERDMADTKAKVINATEGGAKIHGTEVMAFEEAINKYIKEDINVLETIKSKLQPIKEKTKLDQVIETQKKLNFANKYAHDIIQLCEKSVQICERSGEILGTTQLKPEGKDLEEHNSNMLKLSENVDEIISSNDFYLIFMHYVQAFVIKAIQDINYIRFSCEKSIEQDTKLLFKYREYFSVLAALLKKIIDEFEISIKIVNEYRDSFNK